MGCQVLIHAKPATWHSWDFRAKEGSYIGHVLDSYRCFKLVKCDTNSQVISDTVEFLHAHHTIPSPTPEDKIIHGLQVITNVLKNVSPPTSITQLEAISKIRDIVDSWQLLTPPAHNHTSPTTPGCPILTNQELPRVVTPGQPSQTIPLVPAQSPCAAQLESFPPPLLTPLRLSFVDSPPPRVTIMQNKNQAIQPTQPMAHRTRSCVAAAPLAL